MNPELLNTILQGDALDNLKRLPSGSVDCVTTSPPWYQQRDYDVAGQIGLEESVDSWVDQLSLVMRELHRVLADHGSVWLDLGDTYSKHVRFGAPAKCLILAPERLILRLVRDGWIVRNKVIWAKSNPMPDAIADRLSNTYDVVFHIVRKPRYFYDLDSVRVPFGNDGLLGKNPGDVWRLPVANFRGAHFASFPESLVERPILASCPLRVCTKCNQPWRREAGKTFVIGKQKPPGKDPHVRRYRGSWRTLHQPGDLVATCRCNAPARPGLVLDPFFGTGTVGAVAERLGRNWIGIELNPTYIALARQRLGRDGPELKVAA